MRHTLNPVEFNVFPPSKTKILDCQHTNIFPTPFWEYTLDVDNDKIIEECYHLRELDPEGVKHSNINGWQSKVLEMGYLTQKNSPTISELSRLLIDIANDIAVQYNTTIGFTDDEIGWWININDKFSYNVMHSHPDCCLIAVYYPKIPKNADESHGNFCINRSDPSVHNAFFSNVDNFCEYQFLPQEKHLYLMPSTLAHYVTPQFTEEDRISIAFNIG